MRERLAHVSWLGGSPCAGKSSIADGWAARHVMTVYRCDDAYFRHAEVVTPGEQPVFARLARASCDEIWPRPVVRQIREGFSSFERNRC